MKTAKQMFAFTVESQRQRELAARELAEKDCTEIETYIENEARVGRFTLTLRNHWRQDRQISNATVEMLQGAGYTVTSTGASGVVISWENAREMSRDE